MNILITGYTGYIGQPLTRLLLEQGHTVTALCRQIPDEDLHEKLRLVQGDITDSADLKIAMENCDAVFHLAAMAKTWAKDASQFYRHNVEATRLLFDTALALGVKKVVFTSTGAVYGASDGRPLNENDTRRNAFFTDYETSKFIAEEQAAHYVRKGLSVIIVQPTKVYGPGRWTESNAVSFMIRRFIEGEWHMLPRNGQMIGNFSFIDDVVRGHQLALENGKAGEKYILGGVNVSFRDFFAQLKHLSGKHYTTFPIPFWMMMAYGWHEEIGAKWFGHEPRITRPWIRKYNADLALSSEKAVNDLGYSITPLPAGLRKTLDWLENNFHIQ